MQSSYCSSVVLHTHWVLFRCPLRTLQNRVAHSVAQKWHLFHYRHRIQLPVKGLLSLKTSNSKRTSQDLDVQTQPVYLDTRHTLRLVCEHSVFMEYCSLSSTLALLKMECLVADQWCICFPIGYCCGNPST